MDRAPSLSVKAAANARPGRIKNAESKRAAAAADRRALSLPDLIYSFILLSSRAAVWSAAVTVQSRPDGYASPKIVTVQTT